MNEVVYLSFFLDIIVNALLSFGTAWLVIEGLLALFRATNERLKTCLKLLPFLKLPIDLFRYDFSTWAILSGIDPGLEEKGTRILSASFDFFPFPTLDVGFHLANGQKFSLMDSALSHTSMHTMLLKGALLMCAIYCLILLAVRIHSLRNERRRLHDLLLHTTPFQPKIVSEKIRKAQVTLVVTKENTVPFAAFWKGKKWIVFAKIHLRQLSSEEIEAIIAHEFGHIFWRDPFWQTALQLLRCLFFWVPMQALIKRLQKQREYACDCFALSLGVSPYALASALTKIARFGLEQAPTLASPLASPSATGKSCLRKRVEILLKPRRKKVFLQTAALITLACGVAAGKLWIF